MQLCVFITYLILIQRSIVLARIKSDNLEKCLLCIKTIINKSIKQAITENGCQKFVDDAKIWSERDVDSRSNLFEFTNEYQRMFSKEPCGSVSLFYSIFVFRNFE